MKRAISVVAAFAALVLVTAAAQAADKGEQVFKEKCAMCHVVKGKGGKIGPELTKVATKLKDKELIAQLENPKKLNPSSTMPSFKTLPKADMDALLKYLKTLK
ncbi:MAG: cytochrome c [Deltaproteobacteria bacterium]|nr:cytochrome c [Deltaproteobacteria bacterium]